MGKMCEFRTGSVVRVSDPEGHYYGRLLDLVPHQTAWCVQPFTQRNFRVAEVEWLDRVDEDQVVGALTPSAKVCCSHGRNDCPSLVEEPGPCRLCLRALQTDLRDSMRALRNASQQACAQFESRPDGERPLWWAHLVAAIQAADSLMRRLA